MGLCLEELGTVMNKREKLGDSSSRVWVRLIDGDDYDGITMLNHTLTLPTELYLTVVKAEVINKLTTIWEKFMIG